MSSLYSFNNIGYGTSRYQLGLDGTQIPEQKKEAGFFSGMGEAALDILPAAGNSTLAAGLDLLAHSCEVNRMKMKADSLLKTRSPAMTF